MPITLAEMDERVSFRERVQQETGPVVLINTFTVPPEDADQLLAVWAEDAAFMKRQPGFISTQLQRNCWQLDLRQRRCLGVGGSARRGILVSRVPGPCSALPGQRRDPTPSLPESRRARDLRRLVSQRHYAVPSRRGGSIMEFAPSCPGIRSTPCSSPFAGTLATSLAFDVIHRLTRNESWAEVAYWMIVAGIIGGLAAAPFGWIDWFAIPDGTRAKSIGLWHGVGNVVVLALFVVSWFLRATRPLSREYWRSSLPGRGGARRRDRVARR